MRAGKGGGELSAAARRRDSAARLASSIESASAPSPLAPPFDMKTSARGVLSVREGGVQRRRSGRRLDAPCDRRRQRGAGGRRRCERGPTADFAGDESRVVAPRHRGRQQRGGRPRAARPPRAAATAEDAREAGKGRRPAQRRDAGGEGAHDADGADDEDRRCRERRHEDSRRARATSSRRRRRRRARERGSGGHRLRASRARAQSTACMMATTARATIARASPSPVSASRPPCAAQVARIAPMAAALRDAATYAPSA